MGHKHRQPCYLSNNTTDARTIFEAAGYKLESVASVFSHRRLTGVNDVERKTVFSVPNGGSGESEPEIGLASL